MSLPTDGDIVGLSNHNGQIRMSLETSTELKKLGVGEKSYGGKNNVVPMSIPPDTLVVPVYITLKLSDDTHINLIQYDIKKNQYLASNKNAYALVSKEGALDVHFTYVDHIVSDDED